MMRVISRSLRRTRAIAPRTIIKLAGDSGQVGVVQVDMCGSSEFKWNKLQKEIEVDQALPESERLRSAGDDTFS